MVIKKTPRLEASRRAHWLQVGPYLVWTTLTAEDLANPKLWTRRTPLAWAAHVARVQTKRPPERMPENVG